MEMSVDIVEKTKKPNNDPFYVKDLSKYGQVLCIEFSQYEWSQDVILIAFETKILLGHLKFTDVLEVEILKDFLHPCRCTNLNLSPETALNILPNSLTFCSAGSDFNLRVFKSDLDGEYICKVISSHSNYINDVKFDPENNYLSSASDDNTVKIFETEKFKCVTTFFLTSPGMTVDWHKEDSSKLLVAEKIGIIRFYNVLSQRPIVSLDIGKQLSACNWAPARNHLVASLQLGELFLWDITEPSCPKQTSLMFTEAGGTIKFNPTSDVIAAVNSLEGALKVVNVSTQLQRLSATVVLPTNLCWHYKYPVLCVGDDTKLCFWKVTAK